MHKYVKKQKYEMDDIEIKGNKYFRIKIQDDMA